MLTKCPECLKEVSDSAMKCPHCGFVPPISSGGGLCDPYYPCWSKLTATLPDVSRPAKRGRRKKGKDSEKPEPAVGVISLAVALGMAAWGLSSCGILGSSRIVTDDDALWGTILIVGATVALVFGIVCFTDRRPKARSNRTSDHNIPPVIKK